MHRTQDKGLLLIAFLKIIKGLSLLLIGLGALHLLHKDVEAIASYWFDVFRIDSDSKLFGHIVTKVMSLDDHQLRTISAVTFFYSTILFTEGVGLFMGLRWAEFLTIIGTSSFLPFELFEVIAHFSAGRLLLLLVNIAVVAYLIWVVRNKDANRPHMQSAAAASRTP